MSTKSRPPPPPSHLLTTGLNNDNNNKRRQQTNDRPPLDGTMEQIDAQVSDLRYLALAPVQLPSEASTVYSPPVSATPGDNSALLGGDTTTPHGSTKKRKSDDDDGAIGGRQQQRSKRNRVSSSFWSWSFPVLSATFALTVLARAVHLHRMVSNHDFSLSLSLDGPPHDHDSHRYMTTSLALDGSLIAALPRLGAASANSAGGEGESLIKPRTCSCRPFPPVPSSSSSS